MMLTQTDRPAITHSRRLTRLVRRPEAGAFAGAVLVYVFFAIAAGPVFYTASATATWVNASSELAIVAIPVALLLIAGEFDLSIASVIGASSMVVAIGTGPLGLPGWLAILLALALGVVVGLANGFLLAWTKLPSFVVTLATYMLLLGISLGVSTLITGTTTLTVNTTPDMELLFGSKWGPFNVSMLWWIVIAAAATWALSKARFGNWVYATGGDREAASSAGVPISRVKTTLFVATGLGAALVGVIQSVTYHQGDAARGQSFIFECIIAAVIGGVLLEGGYGSAIGATLGVITFGVVSGGVFYTGWPTVWVEAFLGALLLLAVLANRLFRRLALSTGKEEDL